MSKWTFLARIAGGTGAIWAASAASAQLPPVPDAVAEASVPAGAAEPANAGDIIVTARKRGESILKVPVVVTAITEEQLARFSTDDLYTVAQRVPGLLIGTSLAANGLQVSIRGIGTTANNATIDNSISLNLDGVPLSQGLAYGLGLFDVAQVEVLKGPQSLFYGKNSPAGVISLRSIDPTDTFELIARGGYELKADEKVGELIVSGPVTDSLKLRLGGRYSDQKGFFRNTVQVLPNSGSINPTTRRVTPTEDVILRGTALFTPSPGYTARVKASYEYQDLQGTWPALQPGFCPEGTGPVAPRNIQFIGGDCKVNRQLYAAWPDPAVFQGLRNGGKPFSTMRQGIFSLEQTLAVADDISLTSLTGFYAMKQKYLFLAGFATAVPLVSDSDFLTTQLTQELRLQSSFKGPLNFMVGGFLQRADQETRVLLKGNTVLGLPAVSQQNTHKIDIRSNSLFGQILWQITPELEFAPGLRYTREVRVHRQFNFLPASGPIGRSVLLDPRVASTNYSPEATLTWSPGNDLTLFAAYKTGFKSGSFNGTIFAAPTTPASFGDEKVKGGEAGVKARLFDRQLTFNAAGYYYRYSDLQVGAGEIRGATIINRTLNAASADVYGADIDASFTPRGAPGLSLSAAVNYNHARYASFGNAPCGNGQTIGQGCDQQRNPTTGLFSAQDLGGDVLVRAPAWMASLGADYQLPVGNDMALQFGTSANYSSRYSLNLTNLPGFFQPKYVKANASVTLKQRDDRWQISLIGNNLTNQITSANCFNSNLQNGSFFGGQIQGGPLPGPAGGDEANCVAERGRELWVRVATKF